MKMNFSVPFTPLPSVLLDMFPSWGALHIASAHVGLGILTPLGLLLLLLWWPTRERDESRQALRAARLGRPFWRLWFLLPHPRASRAYLPRPLAIFPPSRYAWRVVWWWGGKPVLVSVLVCTTTSKSNDVVVFRNDIAR